MRALFLLAIGSFTCSGQITSIATSGDGRQLWFASGYALKGEPDGPAKSRVYRYAPDTPEVITQADPFNVQLSDPFLSSDGKTSGWRTNTLCVGSCMLWLPRGGLVLDRKGHRIELNGRTTLFLSRNGQWLYESGFPFFNANLTDLDTNSTMPSPVLAPLDQRHAISDAGAVIGVDPPVFGASAEQHEVKLWTPGSDLRSIYQGDRVVSAGISADGKLVLVATENALIRIDPTTKDQQIVLSADRAVRFSMDTSASRVAVLIGRDLVLWGNESKRLYSSPEDVTSFEISDDGSSVYVLTKRSRVVRINVETAESHELYGPTMGAVRGTSYSAVPGSALRFAGASFAEQYTFSAAGLTFPLAKSDPIEFQVQIPWEFPATGAQTFRIGAPDSPFETRGTLYVDGVLRPWIFTIPYQADILAAQQDFNSTVSQQNPAPAGTTIHMWLTGLGALDRSLRTGEVGPADPPARPITPFACYLIPVGGGSAVGLELPFVAYAPGLLGLYQVDATIPEEWPAGKNVIYCTTGDRSMGGSAEIWTSAKSSR